MSEADVAESARRAEATYAALQLHLYDRHSRTYGEHDRRWRRAAGGLWPFANAWAATCALAGIADRAGRYRDDLSERVLGLAAYLTPNGATLTGSDPIGFESKVTPPRGMGGDVYYDDNAWIALALLHQHQLGGDATLPVLAGRIFSFLLGGWSGGAGLARPGGIRWAVPAWSTTRNTCATAPVAETAALLHRITGDSAYLGWAIRCYRWVGDTLRRPDGLYGDRIEADGTVHGEAWSYNQGTMIGAGALLYEETGEDRYLDDALATAAAALDWLGERGALATQGPPFVAIYLRNVLYLSDVVLGDHERSAEHRELVSAYATERWAGARRDDGLFVKDGHVLNPTAGMVAIYSLLAGSAPRP